MTLTANILTKIFRDLIDAPWTAFAPLCEEQPFGEVEFGWWDLIKYYVNILEDSYAGYSWQIWLAFHIVLLSLFLMTAGFSLFWFRIYRDNREKEKESDLQDEYEARFRAILANEHKMSRLQILTALDHTDAEIKKNNAYYYANILEKIRISMHDRTALPNMQALALAVGVADLFSDNLLRNKKVFRTLQMMLMLQVSVNEGRLSKYRYHKNPEVRMMARLNYIMCTTDNPYRHLEEELNDSRALYEPMLLHYTFGWMASQKRNMPNFLYYVENCSADASAAFMLSEIRYWGKPAEKAKVKDFLRDDRPLVRKAAVSVIGELADTSAEDELTCIYPDVSEDLKQDILRTVLGLNTGHQTEFFKTAFHTSASRETQVLALQCMYQYGSKPTSPQPAVSGA